MSKFSALLASNSRRLKHNALQLLSTDGSSSSTTSRCARHWAWMHGDFSRPGKPTDNATIESFNASVRRECLSQHYFSTLSEAEVVLRSYRAEYNDHRPYSSLAAR
jgi:putative transposase